MRRELRNRATTLLSGLPLLWLLATPAFAQTESQSARLSPGVVIESVVCGSDASQSYALYLPLAYASSKKWPIVYLFDPIARGKKPVELYRDIAEKYGFILAASNNSRNFGPDQSRAVNAIWEDTHSRFALDARRIYTSGFSGGARVAGLMAVGCLRCQIAGVIAHGAGYPNNGPQPKDQLLYFFAVGDEDFNWLEVMAIRRKREEQGLPYRVRVFPGPHQWAPVDVMEDAFEWLNLKSMQSGDLAQDSALIDAAFSRTKTEAETAEKQKNSIVQLTAYRMLVSDFAGLRDVSLYESKLAALKKSADLKLALKTEQGQATEQGRLESEISEKLNAYVEGKADDPIALRTEILQAIARLKDQAAHQKNDAQRLVARRAFDGIWVSGIESGQGEFQLHHYDKAAECFRLMSAMRDEPWPELLLAETHAAMGNKKEALKDLREAARRGIKDPAVFENDERLRALRSDPEFQAFLKQLQTAK